MRTSTEFANEISVPRISTSFEFHLDFLVNLGEVGVLPCVYVYELYCLDPLSCHASPSIRHDALS